MLWNDKSKFNLVSSDSVQYFYHPKNERYNSQYEVLIVKHGEISKSMTTIEK